MQKFELHITVNSVKSTLIELITSQCKINDYQLSIGQIKQAINKGALWLSRGKSTQRLRKIKKNLSIGDVIHFYYHQQLLSQKPPQAELIADFHHYSIWYKPYGMLSQGSKWSDHCTINRWVEVHMIPQRPAFIVHRLDRAASGLIVIAHSKKAAQQFTQLFEHRALNKYYQIIVHGQLLFTQNKQNSHDDNNWIKNKVVKNKVINNNIDGKKAISTFSSLDYDQISNTSLLQVKIETGRKHQIRKHASLINLPVVGDRLHGNKAYQYSDDLNLQLSAVHLDFICPFSNDKRCIELPVQFRLNLNKTADKLMTLEKPQ
jgi:tRNA pseudouridine32 synthase/23S rRNA pseudouridine746 synthase